MRLMSPQWVVYRRPLVLVLFAIAVVVTLFFGASVEAQAGAYATGVLALILSAEPRVTELTPADELSSLWPSLVE